MKTHPKLLRLLHGEQTPRLIARFLLLILLLLVAVQSPAQMPGTTPTNHVGVYRLVSVDGKDVPCSINHDGKPMLVQSGTFIIGVSNQVTSVMTVSVGEKKDVRVERPATYTMQDQELTMRWKNAGTTRGRVNNQTFTMTNEGMTYVYQK